MQGIQQGNQQGPQQLNPLILANDMIIRFNHEMALLKMSMEQLFVQLQQQKAQGGMKNHGEKLREFEADPSGRRA